MKQRHLAGLCLPSHRRKPSHEKYVSGLGWKAIRLLWKSLQAPLHSNATIGQDTFSLFEALYLVLSRPWQRTPTLLLLCTIATTLLVAAALWALIPVWKYPFRETLVFTAPVSGSFVRPRSSEPPKFVPRVIHQTYPTLDAVPRDVAVIRQTWVRLSPGWEVQFWDDVRCLDFVRREFPEYYRAYVALPKNVERADFFRYLVLLRYGGVYADIDTELRQPLDEIIRSTDMMVVGWEAEVSSEADMVHRHLARRRQVQQWFIASAPGHPALRRVCDHIARHYADTFSPFQNLDTLERTGPGAWTDAVLATAEQQALKGDRAWSIRFLPQVATGVHPKSAEVHKDGIVVLHHFVGSWKAASGYQRETLWFKLRKWLAKPRQRQHLRAGGGPALAPGREAAPPLALRLPPEQRLYPVSISHGVTTFTMFVPLVGHGDVQSHEDAAAVLTRFGNWQAGMDPTLVPRAPVALVGALGDPASRDAAGRPPPVLLDIGAGLGLYSLTAAARGHRVIATELAPRSLASLAASLAASNATGLVTVQNVTVGAAPGRACVARADGDLAGWLPEDVARGYAAPALHQHAGTGECARAARRVVLGDLVPDGVRVGALRVSAGAWTADVLRGGLPVLARHRPSAVLLEVDTAEMARIGSTDFPDVLQELQDLGYTNMGHAGHVCVARFEAMMQTLRASGAEATVQTDLDDLRQPAWCELGVDAIGSVLAQNRRNGLERQDPMSASGVELLLLQLNSTSAAA